MRKIGIYICNYNKCEYVVRCVESLLRQTYQDRDIYVVDNASTDGSVETLKKYFSDKVSIMQNKENIGGSGGFDVAIRDALEKDYQYMVLCDNDVWVDKDTIQTMYEYMERHADIGILGPKVFQMEKPELIQDFGGSIDARYCMVGNYNGRKDVALPEEMDCDYISTCTAMARISAVRQFGSMPRENFIYWDDVEWSKRCQNNGYRTVAIGTARVWHNFSGADNLSAFARYYMTRNQLNFFAKFLLASEIPAFFECMLREIHAKCYMFCYKGRNDLSETVHNAWEDFLDGIEGEAREGRIIPKPEKIVPDSLTKFLQDNVFITMELNGERGEVTTLVKLLNRMDKGGMKNQISVRVKNMQKFQEYVSSYMDENLYDKLKIAQWNVEGDGEHSFVRLCEDIKQLDPEDGNTIYIDRFLNCIASEKDHQYMKNYKTSFESFKEGYEGRFKSRIYELREKQI